MSLARTVHPAAEPAASPAQRLVLALALALAACVQSPRTDAPAVPRTAAIGGAGDSDAAPGPLYSLFHRPLKAPEGEIEVLRLRGDGAQIFRCESQSTGMRWVYRLPEAELHGSDGALAIRHGANQSFEHVDGSRLVGEIVDNVPSPRDGSLRWLLLATRSFGKGALAGITHVQRIDTVGGMPPASCDAGQLNQVLRVPFSADFVFFRPG
jgi:hypothetical protein